jgi:sulfopyruvate decarboxylase TPP-binding subunit
MLAGADLGGAHGVLLMQSSGTGNCVNMLSLIAHRQDCFVPLAMTIGVSGLT